MQDLRDRRRPHHARPAPRRLLGGVGRRRLERRRQRRAGAIPYAPSRRAPPRPTRQLPVLARCDREQQRRRNEQFGFRLRNGALEMQLGAGNWQALTDSGTVTVTAFSATPSTAGRGSLGDAVRSPARPPARPARRA